MRVLFDVKHPAQARFFEPVIRALVRQGSEALVTARDKDETLEVLDGLGISHVCLSQMHEGYLAMGVELVGRTLQMLRLARSFRPHVLVARTGISAGAVGRLLRVPSVIFDDTEFAWLQRRLSVPLATVVCTGMGYGARFRGKQLSFSAPPQLMYTHPCRFRPDPDRLRRHGMDPEEPYFVLRVKAWRALHDSGVQGPSDRDLTRLVEALRPHGRPVISSERSLPAPLRQCANPLPVKDMLHLLAFARLCVGEGSCTVAEAACLGTPGVFLSPRSRRGYLDALERDYGLTRTVRTPREAIECARGWLEDAYLQERAAAARERLLRDCEDPLAFAVRVLSHYGRERERRRWPS